MTLWECLQTDWQTDGGMGPKTFSGTDAGCNNIHSSTKIIDKTHPFPNLSDLHILPNHYVQICFRCYLNAILSTENVMFQKVFWKPHGHILCGVLPCDCQASIMHHRIKDDQYFSFNDLHETSCQKIYMILGFGKGY